MLAQSSDEIVYDIYLVKKDYLAYKEANPEDKTTTLSKPYNNISKYENNNTELVKVIGESYKSDKYTLSLQKGNLVCLYNPDIMTEEKIKVCEALDIYYLGDYNEDHIIDWWDCTYLSQYVSSGERTTRINIAMDIDSTAAVNVNDTNSMKSFLRNTISLELTVINDLENEYWNYIDANGMYDDDKYTQIYAKTEDEIKQYISSYSKELNLPYEMIIQAGDLYWIYDKTKDYPPAYIDETTFKILGDITGDKIINEKDVERLKLMIGKDSYNASGDINSNGTIDNEDLELLTEMIK